jgi:hypothetical protein
VLRLVVLLLLLPPIAIGALVYFGLSSEPAPVAALELSQQDIARARKILRANDPRHTPAGSTRRVELNEQDLNLAANYLLRNYVRGTVQLGLGKDQVELAGTARLPHVPFRPHVNVTALLGNAEEQPRLAYLQIGQLTVPPVLADALLEWLLKRFRRQKEWQQALNALQRIEVTAKRISVSYRWQPQLIDAVREGLLPAAQRAALQAYYDKLIVLQAAGIGNRGSLTDLLRPLFAYAQTRDPALDPVAENRALLLVLGAWSSGRGMSALLPGALAKRRPRHFGLKLQRRSDLARHFLLSAALAAGSDSRLADAVGLFKEISDVDAGSGFSFTDIAADRAGTRFGELAVRSAAQARRVQQRMAATFPETDLLPPIRDLPEHLSDANFAERYGSVGSPAYQAVMRTIERRLDQAPLLN